MKVWTTIDKNLRDELKNLAKELGFRSETDCLREAIRLGAQNLKAQRSMSAFVKKENSILDVSGLLSKEYERMKPGELELKVRAQWK